MKCLHTHQEQQHFFLSFFLSSTMDITTIAALYLLWRSQICRKAKRRRVLVHSTIQSCTQLSEFRHLLQELCLDDGCFQLYVRMTGAQCPDVSISSLLIGLRDNAFANSPIELKFSTCAKDTIEPNITRIRIYSHLLVQIIKFTFGVHTLLRCGFQMLLKQIHKSRREVEQR